MTTNELSSRNVASGDVLRLEVAKDGGKSVSLGRDWLARRDQVEGLLRLVSTFFGCGSGCDGASAVRGASLLDAVRSGESFGLSIGSTDAEGDGSVLVSGGVRSGGFDRVHGEGGTFSCGCGVSDGKCGCDGVSGVETCFGRAGGESVEDVNAGGSKPGRWATSNRKKRVKRREKKGGVIPEWRKNARPVGFCETVLTQSSCPSYGQAVSDAEREAKESLAKRRAAENALQEKLAKMKLADLEDEQKCQEYAQLKRQRVIQWTNEATAKSQQSLDKCKSIDPGSSSSQFEIRKQAKELADTKMQYEHLVKVFHDAVPDAAKIIAMTKLPGTESMERYQLEGEFIGGWGDDHSISS